MEFKPPSPLFEHQSPASYWLLWKQKFTIYLIASGKSASTEEVKIANLLNFIGDEGVDIYNTFTEDQQATLDKLIGAFDYYFLPKKIVPMETFKFHNLVQGNEQSINQYLTDLKKQARLCEFKCTKATCGESYEDRMIRDQLIIRLKCNESQLRLLGEQALTTEKILEYCKSIELSKEHIKVLTKEEDVNFVKQYKPLKKLLCKKCCYEHFPNRCPAFNKTCASCQVKGHFAKACPNRSEETCEGSSKKNADPPRGERTVNTVQEAENKDNLIYVL
ncbi:uncharacterized protein [Diabrotica undecimpunctata]|uniref:uncharacterized protein n=1 Tax=Diabrotica undecimpunctata TaxID=50387 RepID=UPI003B63F37F